MLFGHQVFSKFIFIVSGLLREAGLSRVIWKSLLKENQKSSFHFCPCSRLRFQTGYGFLLCFFTSGSLLKTLQQYSRVVGSYLVGLPFSAIFGIGMSWDSPGGWGCRSCALTWAPAWAPGWHTTADTTGQTTRSDKADFLNRVQRKNSHKNAEFVV